MLKKLSNINTLYLGIFTFIIVLIGDIAGNMGYRIDIIETFFMSNELALSYPKHPFATFWLTSVLNRFVPQGSIMVCASVLQCALYILLLYAVSHVCGIFNKNNATFKNIATIILICLILIKRIQFTPDFFFVIFAFLFVLGTYYLCQNPSHKNYIFLVVMGLLLFLTKYQAVLVYAAAIIPFVATKKGRNATLTVKAFTYGGIMLACICVYLWYGFSRDLQSFKYASSYTRFDIKNMVGYILFGALLCYKTYQMRHEYKNFNFVFLCSNGLAYYLLVTIGCLVWKHGTGVRLFTSNLPFLCVFLSYIFYKDIAKLTPKMKALLTIIVLTLCLLVNIARVVQMNLNNIFKAHRHFARYLEGVTNQEYTAILQHNREFDQTYPHLSKKVQMLSREMLTSNNIKSKLYDQNFVIMVIPNALGQMPDYMYELAPLFPKHQYEMLPMFYSEVERKYKWQKHPQIIVIPVLFRKPPQMPL